jgi:hypothetical protein
MSYAKNSRSQEAPRNHPWPTAETTAGAPPPVPAFSEDPAFFAECVERIKGLDMNKLPNAAYADVLETLGKVQRHIAHRAGELARQERALATREATLDEREHAVDMRFAAVRAREALVEEQAPTQEARRGWWR